jgi:outer membrane lipoprotein-sorting protein
MRVSLVGDLAESDVVRDGHDVWVWSSRDNTVNHATLPTHAAKTWPTMPPVDPTSVAERVLAAVDPTTAVRVDGTARVAGRPVYELVVSPRSVDSLIGQVRLAVDSETSMPLRVQVLARGASSPAFETAFSSISFATPDPSVFTFTPPPGAEVTQTDVPSLSERPSGSSVRHTDQTKPTVIGSGWTAVVEIPGASAALSGSSKQASSSLDTLLRATTPVSGSFGRGRLLETSLVSVLLLDDGRAFVGAVTPEALERAAASA